MNVLVNSSAKKKTDKKKNAWQQVIVMACFVLIGVACGIVMVWYVDRSSGSGESLFREILSLIALFFIMYAAIFAQIIIHEAGHLIFGLLSGYQFSSFRIFSFMWVKENGGIRLRRLSVAGTGGQCLMAPPDMVDGKVPLVLYNLGGSLMNLISAGVCLGLYFVFDGNRFLSAAMLMSAVIGVVLAIMNGVPMRMGTVDNDGYNAFSLTRNSEAMRSFWIQMKVNDEISKGRRLKDMPEEWFATPTDEAMKNSMIAVMGVLAANRLMDAHEFEEAKKLIDHLLGIDTGMVGVHRNLMICDRINLELMEDGQPEVIEKLYTRDLQKFMKSMKNYPSILRTQYVYALLYEKDPAGAENIKGRFEKCAKSYPYPNDIQSERELMELAEERCQN